MKNEPGPAPEAAELVRPYVLSYCGVNLPPHRLKELVEITALLVGAVDAHATRIAFGDDPQSFPRTLEELSGRQKRG
jgi:hypothetical protein